MLLDIESHPTWVCGLKQSENFATTSELGVTPYVGVWIETLVKKMKRTLLESHPTWVCGLKQCQWKSFPAVQLSHPTWVCGLKHGCVIYINCMRSHTLRGCVD